MEGYHLVLDLVPSAQALSKCEIWFFDTQNTLFLIVRGLKNTFFMPIMPLLYCYPTIFDRATASRKEELGFLVVG